MEYGVSQVTLDSFGTESDRFALEEGTDSSGAISRIFLKDGGEGYSLLPSVSISTTTGTGGALLATTTDIGAVDSVKITNQGFKYTVSPEVQFRANLFSRMYLELLLQLILLLRTQERSRILILPPMFWKLR